MTASGPLCADVEEPAPNPDRLTRPTLREMADHDRHMVTVLQMCASRALLGLFGVITLGIALMAAVALAAIGGPSMHAPSAIIGVIALGSAALSLSCASHARERTWRARVVADSVSTSTRATLASDLQTTYGLTGDPEGMPVIPGQTRRMPVTDRDGAVGWVSIHFPDSRSPMLVHQVIPAPTGHARPTRVRPALGRWARRLLV